MSAKIALTALTFVVMALAGCTSGSDGDGGTSGTSTSGGVGVGGTVTGPGGSVGGNASMSGSASATGTNGTGPGANMTEEVSITGMKFSPNDVTVSIGGTVKWTHNDGTTAHTVTADDGSFDSSPNCSPPLTVVGDCMTQGDTYTATFASAGEFPYHCKVHASMTGTVRVVEP